MDVKLKNAIYIACNALQGIVDEGGVPHIFHNLYILNHLRDYQDLELLQIAALVGISEHIDYLSSFLRDGEYSNTVIECLRLLDESNVTDYRAYARKVAGSEPASKILKLSERYYNRVAQLAELNPAVVSRMSLRERISFFYKVN